MYMYTCLFYNDIYCHTVKTHDHTGQNVGVAPLSLVNIGLAACSWKTFEFLVWNAYEVLQQGERFNAFLCICTPISENYKN